MDKATMLYNKFKSMFLVGEGDCVLSQVLNKSLAEQRQHEEAKKGALKRVEQAKENSSGTIYYRFNKLFLMNFKVKCLEHILCISLSILPLLRWLNVTISVGTFVITCHSKLKLY